MHDLPKELSLTKQLSEIRNQDEEAIAALWDQYYPVLCEIADKRLNQLGVRQRAFGGDDVAASALASFFKAIRRDRFPALDSDNGLFRLLKRITLRKVIDRKRRSETLKAGGGELRGESAFGATDRESGIGIEGVNGNTPTPEWLTMAEEECKHLFELLDDPELQAIACLKLDGHSNAEIASLRGYSLATVERRLKLIRTRWTMEIDVEP